MDWNPIEGNSKQIKERWGDFTEGGVDKIIGHQKVRCVQRKQREASLAEIWDVVSFWTKLFAFSWLLMVQVAGLMMGRIFPELSIYRRYRALGARLPFEGEREQISRDWTRVDAPGALTVFEKLNQGVHWFADQMRRGESNA